MTVDIRVGDALAVLKDMPDESVHCVVTSPPYWALRDYGVEPTVHGGDSDCDHEWGPMERGKRKDMLPADETKSRGRSGKNESQDGAAHNGGRFCVKCGAWLGTLGNEPDLDMHVAHLVEIFREVRRVLRPDGTLWLNYGDAYTSGGRATYRSGASENKGHRVQDDQPRPRTPTGLKPKDLMMMPARVAMALQDDGWFLRSEIIWHKPNPMPESCRDRPTSAHEKVFLLTKTARYFYDAQAVRTPMKDVSIARLSQATFDQQKGGPKDAKTGNRSHRRVLENLHKRQPAGWATSDSYQGQDARYADRRGQEGRKRGVPPRHAQYDSSDRATLDGVERNQGANLRNVWTIATAPFKGAHFATFPPALIEPCIKAGTSEHGVCPDCGAPWERVVEKSYANPGNRTTNGPRSVERRHETAGFSQRLETRSATTGFRPSCACYDERYRAEHPEPRRARKRRQRTAWAGRWKRVRARPGNPEWPTVPAVVLDPFGGAGTVGLVAERLGRDSILIEINPDYAEMARKRIEDDVPPSPTKRPAGPVCGPEDLPLFRQINGKEATPCESSSTSTAPLPTTSTASTS